MPKVRTDAHHHPSRFGRRQRRNGGYQPCERCQGFGLVTRTDGCPDDCPTCGCAGVVSVASLRPRRRVGWGRWGR